MALKILRVPMTAVLFALSFHAFAASGRNDCEALLAKVAVVRQRLAAAAHKGADLKARVATAFRGLDPKLRDGRRDQIFAFLTQQSPRPDRVALLANAKAVMTGKQGVLDDALIERAGRETKLTAEDVFRLRQHPGLLELERLFEVPHVEQDYARLESNIHEVIEAVKSLDALEKQLTLRAVLIALSTNQPTDVSAYAYVVLLEAASRLARAEKNAVARRLAAGLGQVIRLDQLDVQSELAAHQKTHALLSLAHRPNLALARLKIAARRVFLQPNLAVKPGTVFVNAGMAVALGAWYGFKLYNSNAWDPVSYYTLQNELLAAWALLNVYNYGRKYQTVAKEGPLPIIFQSGTQTKRYLGEEIEAISDVIDAKTQDAVLAVAQAVRRPRASIVSPPPVPAPAPQSPPELEEVENTPVISAPTPVPQARRPTASPTDVLTTLLGLDLSFGAPVRVTDAQRSAASHFFSYFAATKTRVVERNAVIDHFAIGLLMPKTANVQILSEPGTAKTTLPEMVLNGITDTAGNSSVFTIQMTKETSIDDLLGPVKPSEITKNDRIVRASENALPGRETAILDEYYRAPTYTRETLLGFQADGKIRASGEVYQSKSRLVIYTSNTYPSQVFAAAKDDSPRAEMDRMLFTHVLPPIFEFDENMIELPDIRFDHLPKLNYDEIDQLRDVVKQISVERYFRSKLKLLFNRLRDQQDIREHESVTSWHNQAATGALMLTSPEYGFRVLSPRSEGVAQRLMPRFATLAWINGGARTDAPRVTEREFNQLAEYFLVNSASKRHLERVLRQYADGSAKHQQIDMILKARAHYATTLAALNEDIEKDPISEGLGDFADALHVAYLDLIERNVVESSLTALDPETAHTLADLMTWYQKLRAEAAARPPVVETEAHDVALDRALYLARLILVHFKATLAP